MDAVCLNFVVADISRYHDDAILKVSAQVVWGVQMQTAPLTPRE